MTVEENILSKISQTQEDIFFAISENYKILYWKWNKYNGILWFIIKTINKFIKPPVAVAFLVLPYTQWRFCFQGLFPSHKWGHNNHSVNFICSNRRKFWEVSSSPGTLKGKKFSWIPTSRGRQRPGSRFNSLATSPSLNLFFNKSNNVQHLDFGSRHSL